MPTTCVDRSCWVVLATSPYLSALLVWVKNGEEPACIDSLYSWRVASSPCSVKSKLNIQVPFQSLLQINVPHRHSDPFSFSPDGPKGRGHM